MSRVAISKTQQANKAKSVGIGMQHEDGAAAGGDPLAAVEAQIDREEWPRNAPSPAATST